MASINHLSSIINQSINQPINKSIKTFINVSEYLAYRLIGEATKGTENRAKIQCMLLQFTCVNYSVLVASKGTTHPPTAHAKSHTLPAPMTHSPISAKIPNQMPQTGIRLWTSAKGQATDPRKHPSAIRPEGC